MTDDPGVMGNLPRSRPGTRSAKRGGSGDSAASKPASGKSAAGRTTAKRAKPSATAAKPKTTAAKPGTTAAGKASAGKPRTTAKGSATARARTRSGGAEARSAAPATEPRPPSAAAQHGGTDPLTGAVILAGKAVGGGLTIAREIIRRLPRP